MEDLQPEELEELVQELAAESDAEGAASPEVEKLLQDLEPERPMELKVEAVRQLGELSSSNPQIVEALADASMWDASPEFRRFAAASLLAPAHQAIIEQHPGLLPQHVKNLLREIEEGGLEEAIVEPEAVEEGLDEAPSVRIDAVLHALEHGPTVRARARAAERLGQLEESNLEIVESLIAACQSDSGPVTAAAAESLRTPVHQEYLRQHPELAARVEQALQESSGTEKGADGGKHTASPTEGQAKMQKEVRSWGLWWLGLGLLSLILSGFSEPWGAVLLIGGLGSLVFREASMFVVYGTTIAWAAISNIFTGQISWIVFAVFQLLIAFVVFRKYARYRDAESAMASDPDQQRASRAFPQIGCAFGALALAGLAIVIVLTVIVMGVSGSTEVPQLLLWLEGLTTGLAVLGLAAALASLLSGYRHRLISILGLVACGLVLLLQIVFALVGWLGSGAQAEAPATTFTSAASTPVPPVSEGTPPPGLGRTSYMTDGKLEENIPSGSVVVGGMWVDIALASDGALWFVTLCGGVVHFDGETWTHYTEDDGLASNLGLQWKPRWCPGMPGSADRDRRPPVQHQKGDCDYPHTVRAVCG